MLDHREVIAGGEGVARGLEVVRGSGSVGGRRIERGVFARSAAKKSQDCEHEPKVSFHGRMWVAGRSGGEQSRVEKKIERALLGAR